ncbi:methanol O-anthraniloyltransferase-like [Olea europaea var. sylvestris]|uniref:methanol O-anthraniloyltransferase-like n=1 Tax=Olea europaea var. sylvestris TaxID=158386 RepID=UPI000C1CDF38|nr:methanol O-anthraniloyltransferase-like [Olea europaea var. sylvestris]
MRSPTTRTYSRNKLVWRICKLERCYLPGLARLSSLSCESFHDPLHKYSCREELPRSCALLPGPTSLPIGFKTNLVRATEMNQRLLTPKTEVTRFICGGFALGIRLNHTMADAYGMMQFLNSISELIKGASAPSISPVWQREQYLNARSPPRITCMHHEFEQIRQSRDFMDSDKLFRTSIFFTPKVIQALYNRLSLSGSSRRCSRFDLIIACLWKCRTNALNPSNPDETVRLSVITNLRGKPGLKIPTGYYGNAFVYPAAVSTARILCTAPLSYAVQLIQNAKAQMSEEYIKSVADLIVIKKRPKYATDWNFLVSDITRLRGEKIDLGWGNAVYGGVAWATSNLSFCTNFKNSKGEDGVVVPICLPPLAVEKFKYELEEMTCEPLCGM